MIILAHDGTLYGDWVAAYAIRFAVHESDRKLLLLYVEDGRTSPEIAEARLSRLKQSCLDQGIDIHLQILPLGESTYRTLRQAIPHEPESLLICGTRIKPRKQKLVTGSIAEKLLRIHQCPVLAIRIAQPGVFGVPDNLLFHLTGHHDADLQFQPILNRFVPHLRLLHLLRTVRVNLLRHPYLSHAQEQLMRQHGSSHIATVRERFVDLAEADAFKTTASVAITSDWVNEVLMQASRLKVQMILTGVPEQSLTHRIFHGDQLERLLLQTPCDVGIFHGK